MASGGRAVAAPAERAGRQLARRDPENLGFWLRIGALTQHGQEGVFIAGELAIETEPGRIAHPVTVVPAHRWRDEVAAAPGH